MNIAKRIEKLETRINPPEKEPSVVTILIGERGDSEWRDSHKAEIDNYIDQYVAERLARDPGRTFFLFTVRKTEDGGISITGGG